MLFYKSRSGDNGCEMDGIKNTCYWALKCMDIIHVEQVKVYLFFVFFNCSPFNSLTEVFCDEFMHCTLVLICMFVGILRSLRAAELKCGHITSPRVKAWACRDLGLTTDPAEEAGATMAWVAGDPLTGCDVEDTVEVRPATLEDVPHFRALARTCFKFACLFFLF